MKRCLVLVLVLFYSIHSVCQTITPAGTVNLCTGGSVVLTASAGNSYQWQKDGAPIAGAVSQTYTATAAGSYNVIITTVGTPATSPSTIVKINTKPVPAITTAAGSTCSGTPVLFTSTVTGGTAPYKYAWAFGDLSTSTTQNPSHAFTSLGCGNANFTNTLTVTDANGCTGSVNGSPVNIKQAPDVQLQDQNIFSPFSNCENSPTVNNPNYTVTIDNISLSKACITGYTLNWGDGSPLLTNPVFPLTHTYTKVGAYPLTITGTGANGCSNSKTYTVANQSNPDIGIGTFGPTEGCSDLPVNIVLTTWQGNSPGTTYMLEYGDGSIKQMTHPINAALTDDTITHIYNKTSCPNAFGFPLTITATNGCRTKTFTGGNIQVKTKPQAGFTVVTNPACAGQSVCFSNETSLGYYTNCATNTIYSWNFGDPASGANNTSAQPNPCHTYATAGTYTVTLTTSNPCGPSTITKQVCISDPAAPAFTLSNNSICAGTTVTTTNGSVTSGCTNVAYQWTVTYAAGFCGTTSAWSFAAGSTATSATPSFVFNNPGTYTVQLAVTGSCGNAVAQKTVTVKQPPAVTLAAINNACGQATICPTATVVNCGTSTLTYAWEFDGGNAGTSTNANPGCITFNTPGLHTIKVSVTNECGTTIATQQFSNNTAPDLTIPATGGTFCGDETIGAFTFSSTIAGGVISWTNNNTGIGLAANGTGNIASFIAANTTGAPITATITVTATVNGCPTTKTFTITVNPKPAAPVVTSPVNYCHNDVPAPLKATATAGNALLWYTTATGGTGDATTPTPVTSATGTTTYYVSQKNSATGCESNRSAIVVNVSAIPVISGSSAINPSICASATGSITLTGLTPSTTYSVQYSKNGGSPVTVSLVANASGAIVITGLTAGMYSTITVSRNGCISGATGPFTLSDPNPPATPVAGSDAPLCEGNILHLTANSATPGVTYTWTGPNGFTSTVQNPVINGVQLINGGNYFVTATLTGCASPSAQVAVVINPRPVAPVVTANLSVCLNDDIHLVASTSFAGAVSWSWTGPNGFTSSEQNPVIPNATMGMSGVYSVTATSTTGSCTSPIATTNVAVLPVPVITGSSFINPVGCSSSTGAIILNGLQAFTTYTVQYVKDGGPMVTGTLTSNPDGSIIISGLQAGNYTNVGVSASGCISNIVGPFMLADTPPFSVIAESNGPVCQGTTLLLTARATAPGSATYTWTGPNGFTSGIQNPVITNADAANNGLYEVMITINGCSSKGNVTATVASTTIGGQTDADGTACRGKNRGTVNLTGYNGNVIRWESSVNNGVGWSPILNTSSFLNYENLTLTTWYRAVVQNAPCTIAYSDITIITVINSVQSVFFTPTTITTCNHDTTITFNATAIYSGSDPVNYYWYVNGGVQGRNNTLTYRFRSPLNNPANEEFSIRVLAENTAGCGDTSQPGKVVIYALPTPDIQVSPSKVQREPRFDFTFTDNATASTGKAYTWLMGDTSQPKSGREVSYGYKKTGTYKVNLFVLDRATNCRASDSVYVTIIPVPGSLVLPNAFYPNSAHPELRTFKLQGIGLKKYRLQIFDAWGKIVFETTELNSDGSPKVAWNGRYMNTGQPLPQDAYAWRITEIELENGKKWDGMSYNGGPAKPFGNVTLIR